MKDYALELVAEQKGFNAKLNILREYLQSYILRILHQQSWFDYNIFLGGTALRFLYGLPRFSEDLDFSCLKNKKIDFNRVILKLEQELKLAGYDISIKYSDKKPVCFYLIKFERLMFEAGLSPHKKQFLSIKIEIDTNPPKGAQSETNIITKYFPLSFITYDLPSLFAGKIHSLLNRKYSKGRDFFDLGWYLSKWHNINPNIKFLQNALMQTHYKETIPDKNNWRDCLHVKVEQTDWQTVYKDVENFLEHPQDREIFTKKNVLKLLKIV